MKILFASAYLPYPLTSGGRIRSYHLLRELGRRHEVHLVALDHDTRIESEGASPVALGETLRVDTQGDTRAEPLHHACASIRLIPAPRRLHGLAGRLWRLCFQPDDIVMTRTCPRLERELHARLLRERYDLLLLEELGAAPYLHLRDRPPTVLSKHNAEGRLLDRLAALKKDRSAARALAYLEATAARRREQEALGQVDAVILPSEADVDDLCSATLGRPVFIVPNGVDTAQIRPQTHPEDGEATMLFCGALFWYPNVDAVLWFWRDMLPLVRLRVPHVRLRIVGASPSPAIRALGRAAGVEVFADVDDTRPHLAAATLCIVPLRAGSGSRLKILEALAAGRAVVTTTMGAEGLDLVSGREIRVADGVEGFARAVIDLLADPSRRAAIEQAGRAAVEARYDWSHVLRNLDRICTETARKRPPV